MKLESYFDEKKPFDYSNLVSTSYFLFWAIYSGYLFFASSILESIVAAPLIFYLLVALIFYLSFSLYSLIRMIFLRKESLILLPFYFAGLFIFALPLLGLIFSLSVSDRLSYISPIGILLFIIAIAQILIGAVPRPGHKIPDHKEQFKANIMDSTLIPGVVVIIGFFLSLIVGSMINLQKFANYTQMMYFMITFCYLAFSYSYLRRMLV